jgi:hypothetical protein
MLMVFRYFHYCLHVSVMRVRIGAQNRHPIALVCGVAVFVPHPPTPHTLRLFVTFSEKRAFKWVGGLQLP